MKPSTVLPIESSSPFVFLIRREGSVWHGLVKLMFHYISKTKLTSEKA